MPSLLSIVIVLFVGVISIWIYFFRKNNTNAQLEDGVPMPKILRLSLVVYLLLFGSCLLYLLIALNSLDFPETGLLPDIAPGENQSFTAGEPNAPQDRTRQRESEAGIGRMAQAQPAETAPDNRAPILLKVFPQWTVGSTPTVALTLYGRNFQSGSKVRFNSRERAIRFVGTDLIEAPLEPRDLLSMGSVMVDVVNPGNHTSNVVSVPVIRPTAPLHILGWRPTITREVQLLLLAVCAGALGSYLHAIQSLADFIGNRTLITSWFWWYITRPFLGMAMALIFYAVLRGGFLAGTPADAKIVNPFGVVVVGALVGMFADKAAQKLGEIFDTMFTSEDPRGGKLAAPAIDKLEPDTVQAGTPTPVVLKISGDRLGKVSSLRLNSEERKPDTVSEHALTLMLSSDDMKEPREIMITAVNADGSVSPAAKLRVVKGLSIDSPGTDVLPNATVSSKYDQKITASGGLEPYTWSVDSPLGWLQIDQTGTLSGMPTTPGDTKVTVKVSDQNKASASKMFNLTVTS